MPKFNCSSCNKLIRDHNKKKNCNNTILCSKCYYQLKKDLSINEGEDDLSNDHSSNNDNKSSDCRSSQSIAYNYNSQDNRPSTSTEEIIVLEPETKKIKLSFRRLTKFTKR